MASLARPGVAYTLRGALYLALTNQTNATPLTRLRGPAFSMPASSKFQLLTEPEPTAAELVDVIDAFYDALPPIASSGESDPGVVFAGYGEPLLRHDVLCDALREIRARRHGIATRVATNGLVDVAVCDALRDAGLRSVTVNFASADPDEYARIMAPRDGRTQGDALAFIERCSELGMEVEATTTRTPGVDIARARELTMALGASAFREREYFP